ncbi:hypothetical protein BOTBODRAFT_36597 [Botryobasidium botryosum FD-172 SS1]|uniref:F-box domain-containing protein n=1 Tax=Botryobasidium botryosum (strain FD-172 SS1) TaxID=930990 RepID=A0A067M2I2_BOTB1|nr:hypothetical protein BOTBODRAFT_36597 [Botryobasidium botryosum FD-172 SS1]
MEFATLPQMMQTLIDEAQRQFVHHSSAKPDADLPPISIANEIRKAVDEEMRAIELVTEAVKAYAAKSLVNLRRRWNQVAPIHRLPHQLLSDIFYLAHYSASSDPFVHRLSTVSHLWRQIVEASPLLWTIIHPRCGVLVDHLLARSCEAPLSIHLKRGKTFARGAIEDYAARVTPHSHRWEICDLAGPPELLKLFLQSPAPKLEMLILVGFGSRVFDRSSHIDFPVFTGDTSSLYHLSLETIYIPLTSPIYINLLHLRLGHLHFTESAHQLLDILESSSRLEELVLEWIVFGPPSDAATAGRVIELPHLRRLSLSEVSGGSPAHYILSHVAIPATSELYFILTQDDSLESALPQHSASLPYQLRNISSTDHLQISLEEGGTHGFGGWVCRLQGRPHGSASGGFSFQIQKSVDDVDELHPLLSSIGTVFPMSLRKVALKFYHAGDPTYYHPSTDPSISAGFAEFLSRYPLIEHISFDECRDELLEILTITPTRHLCPLLQNVAFHYCDWVTNAELINLVESRADPARSGPSRLQSLEIVGRRDSSTISKLRKFVAVVHDLAEGVYDL